MKKALPLLLCLALLLSACTVIQLPPAASAGTTPAAVPSQTAAAETPAPESTDPAPVTEPAPPLFSGTVTAGGFRVHTDTSGYRPYAAPESLFTLPEGGTTEVFVPSADYGAVYPYACGRLVVSWGDGGFTEDNGYLYGMIDASGRILTNGIYVSVALMQVVNAERSVTLPFWMTVSATELSEKEDTWYGRAQNYGVISMDGSFALPCEYASVVPMEDSFLCARSIQEPDFTVYDLNGTPRFTGEDVYSGTQTRYWWVDYGEDLYVIGIFPDEDTSYYWYCRKDGTKVLGPYADAAPFCDGLACVSPEGSYYGYIDKEGNWIIDAQYRSLVSFHHGRAAQRSWDNRSVLLDKAGRQLLESEERGYLYRADDDCYACYNPSTESVSFYDQDGALLQHTPGSSDSLLNKTTYVSRSDRQCRLYRLSGEQLVLDLVDYIKEGSTLVDGKVVDGYLCRFYGDMENPASLRIVTPDLSECLFSDAGNPDNSRDLTDEITGEQWVGAGDGSFRIINRETQASILIPTHVETARVFNGRLFVVTANACAYYDSTGKLLFRRPVDAED